MIELLTDKTNIIGSKSEARRLLDNNALSVNKKKIKKDYVITDDDIINDKYIVIQKGKKNYYLLILN